MRRTKEADQTMIEKLKRAREKREEKNRGRDGPFQKPAKEMSGTASKEWRKSHSVVVAGKRSIAALIVNLRAILEKNRSLKNGKFIIFLVILII